MSSRRGQIKTHNKLFILVNINIFPFYNVTYVKNKYDIKNIY